MDNKKTVQVTLTFDPKFPIPTDEDIEVFVLSAIVGKDLENVGLPVGTGKNDFVITEVEIK